MQNHMQGFESFLTSHPKGKPSRSFSAYGLKASKPPRDGWGRLPSGDILLYPAWLVFLSLHEEDTRAWYERIVGDVVDETKSILKLKKWVANPATFVIDVAVKANELRKEEREFWEKTKANKHSFFMPLKTVRSVEIGHYKLQGQYVKVTSSDETVVICENLDYENVFQQLKNTFGGQWQPEFVKALQDAASRNK